MMARVDRLSRLFPSITVANSSAISRPISSESRTCWYGIRSPGWLGNSSAGILHHSNNWRGSTKWLLHVVWIVRLFICLQIEHLVNLGTRRDDVWKLLLKKCRMCRIVGHFIQRILHIVKGSKLAFPDK